MSDRLPLTRNRTAAQVGTGSAFALTTMRVLALAAARTGAAAAVILALSGCASTTVLAPIPAQAPVIFESAAPAAAPVFSVGVSDAANSRAGETGAAVGATIGAVLGLACGAYFIVCSPFLALVLAPVGATTALALGNTETLPPELSLALTQAIEATGPTTRPADDMIAAALAARRGPPTDNGTPVTRIVVRIDEVSLRAITQQQSHVELRGRVEVSHAGRTPRAGHDIKAFKYLGPATEVATWLDRGSPALAHSLREAYRLAGATLAAELSTAPTPAASVPPR